jgi:hypothetical protein
MHSRTAAPGNEEGKPVYTGSGVWRPRDNDTNTGLGTALCLEGSACTNVAIRDMQKAIRYMQKITNY